MTRVGTNPLKDLIELVKISSTTEDVMGVDAVADKFRSLLKDLPLDWHSFSGAGRAKFWIARTKHMIPNKPVILLSGHHDTVFGTRQAPITDSRARNIISGAGTQDMKGGLIVMAHCLNSLHKRGLLYNFIIVLNPEEEYMKTYYYKELLQSVAKEASHIMVFESTLDSKPDAPLSSRSIVPKRKGIYAFSITVQGPGGHAGVLLKKKERNNTIAAAARFITDIERLQHHRKGLLLNIGTFEGGHQYNTIPAIATLKGEIRFWKLEDFARFKTGFDLALTRMKARGNFQIKLEEKGPMPPLYPDSATKEFVQIVRKVAKKQAVTLEIEERGGRSDACWLKRGNPSAAVLDGFGVRGGKQHTKDEYILTDSIIPASHFAEATIVAIQQTATTAG